MYTHRLYLFGMLTKANMKTEKRLRIYLNCFNNSYMHIKFHEVAYVNFKHDIMDALTNVKWGYMLITSLGTSRIDQPNGQWMGIGTIIDQNDSKLSYERTLNTVIRARRNWIKKLLKHFSAILNYSFNLSSVHIFIQDKEEHMYNNHIS